ncbi:MAG: twin-arginine translocase TatA/TatE family subunit [Verrucomicrobiales bacterium]|nr:twin-arginine translocase TatA/TatE family subunit [Verrucomicrobiales bacterium]
MGMPGVQELLVVLVIVILLFGAKKIPDLARGMGRGLGEFKKGKIEGESTEKEDN